MCVCDHEFILIPPITIQHLSVLFSPFPSMFVKIPSPTEVHFFYYIGSFAWFTYLLPITDFSATLTISSTSVSFPHLPILNCQASGSYLCVAPDLPSSVRVLASRSTGLHLHSASNPAHHPELSASLLAPP